ncbi:hypothetical protein HanRHA438_Chr09g0385511 [Helianthus annuus]|nr:hypothetical protein HanRHA438_Chr09g0385511 [Helianthus annuus]
MNEVLPCRDGIQASSPREDVNLFRHPIVLESGLPFSRTCHDRFVENFFH